MKRFITLYFTLLLSVWTASIAHASEFRVADTQVDLYRLPNGEGNQTSNPACRWNELGITDTDNILTVGTEALSPVGTGCVIDADADAEFVEFTALTYDNYPVGGTCEASIQYTGDLSLYTFTVYQGSSQVSDTINLLNVGSEVKTVEGLIYPCGDGSTRPEIRITSTSASAAAGTLLWVKSGRAWSLGAVAQPEIVVQAFRDSTAQSMSGTAALKVDLNAETWDDYGEFSSGTFTAKRNSRARISAHVKFSAVTTNSATIIYIYKNGAELAQSRAANPQSTAPTVAVQTDVDLAINDTIEIYVASDDAAYEIETGVGNTHMEVAYFPSGSQIVQRGDVTDLSGFAKSEGTASCQWTTTSGTIAAFTADSDCPTPITTSGNATSPATKIPAFIAPALKPGKYNVFAFGLFGGGESTSGSQSCQFEIFDGTNSGGRHRTFTLANKGSSYVTTLVGNFEYTSTQKNTLFQIRALRETGNSTCIVEGQNDLSFTLIPLSQGVTKPFIPSSVFYDDEVKAQGEAGVNTIYSGATSPTAVGITNVDSVSATTCRYHRVGSYVFGNCITTVDCTASPAGTEYEIPLPVASDFTATTDASGVVGSFVTSSAGESGVVTADTSNDRLQVNFGCLATSAQARHINFSYVVQ